MSKLGTSKFMVCVQRYDGVTARKAYWQCPACRDLHAVNLDPFHGQPVWTWNGDYMAPTLGPSIRTMYGGKRTDCHCFMVDGQIQFCGDTCAGGDGEVFANRTVPMVDLPRWFFEERAAQD